MPGKNCNLSCSHCANLSGPGEITSLTDDEIDRLIDLINSNPIKELLFTGGEPTLYIPTINKILNRCKYLNDIFVAITTNGLYAKNKLSTKSTLQRIKKISYIQLSFDIFHGSDKSIERVVELERYCKEHQIKFSVSVSISDPTQLIIIKQLNLNIDSPITFQKVESSGRAKATNTQYKYFHFDSSVLDKKCPNLDMISYIPNTGYTNCCSNLIFNNIDNQKYANSDIDTYLKSDFFKTMSQQTFGDVLRSKNIDINNLEAKHSSPCTLCEYIHRG
ncbi:MAG: radical SAM protein [Ignavibacteriales bacterium]|nr:radical SAM protein [Ignavibacteriales bacterium]